MHDLQIKRYSQVYKVEFKSWRNLTIQKKNTHLAWHLVAMVSYKVFSLYSNQRIRSKSLEYIWFVDTIEIPLTFG